MIDSVVQEIDLETGLVLFEWHALDHLPLSASYYKASSSRQVFDPYHVNSVVLDRDGNLVVSMRNTCAVYKIDHRTGRVLWTLGGKQSSFRMGPGTHTVFQHDAVVQSDGTITMFDDGGGPPFAHPARGIQERLDLRKMTVTLIRADGHSPPLDVAVEGGMQLLRNGDASIGWGSQPFFSEYSRSGRQVFDAHFVNPIASYEADRFEWSAQPRTLPALAISPRSDGSTSLYASWNGATDVSSWRALAGFAPNALAPVAARSRTGFETALSVHTAAPYFAVQALGARGQVLASSIAIKTPRHTAFPSIHLIKHVVVIMQENRSFDSYFGTYPGADGYPTKDGRFTVCVPNPVAHRCDYPYHDPALVNVGAKHNAQAARADIAGGRMNGFIGEAQRSTTDNPHKQTDVMGYHDAREIPNYWTYAQDFVLQDHMFESDASWSLPSHLFTLSEWSARCATPDPSSCRNDDEQGNNSPLQGGQIDPPLAALIYHHLNQRNRAVEHAVHQRGKLPPRQPLLPHHEIFSWTDMTYLLYRHHVSWAYYVAPGTPPDCADDAALCSDKPRQAPGTPGIWNPLPNFQTVRIDAQQGNIQSTSNFYAAARDGTLPSVSWIVPNEAESEHAPALVSDGMRYVTTLIDAIMRSPDWDSTAIFLTWDDWGGFYDHVAPAER